MAESTNGLIPLAGCIEKYLQTKGIIDDPTMPEIDIFEYPTLLDSVNIGAEHWQAIALDIGNRYDDYDGFIVLHGTDTMAYTASALPFLLPNLNKPVVVTGSQIPLSRSRSDAHGNLLSAITVASSFDIPEVVLLFGSKILRGCRSLKIDASGFDAFDSPNFPALGSVGVKLEIRKELMLKTTEEKLEVLSLRKNNVGILRLFPDITPEYVNNVLRSPLQGVVLETYGQGNAPNNNKELLRALKDGADRGVLIVNISQCLQGRVNQETYASGQALAEARVVSGLDMTPCAALVKLNFLLSQDYSRDEMRQKLQESICGELTQTDS